MEAFWWFKDNQIAGMARPGFNKRHWYGLQFDEAILVGWLGQLVEEKGALSQLLEHVNSYGKKVAQYVGLDEKTFNTTKELFKDRSALLEILSRFQDKTKAIEGFEIRNDDLHFKLSQVRLREEIDFLKERQIGVIVSCTEHHHHREILEEKFKTYHYSINDLTAPRLEQVQQLAEVLQAATKDRQRVVVHCLAGIGRTSTMLMAAHLLMGESFEGLKGILAKKNPTFKIHGSQGEFIQSVADISGRFPRS